MICQRSRRSTVCTSYHAGCSVTSVNLIKIFSTLILMHEYVLFAQSRSVKSRVGNFDNANTLIGWCVDWVNLITIRKQHGYTDVDMDTDRTFSGRGGGGSAHKKFSGGCAMGAQFFY